MQHIINDDFPTIIILQHYTSNTFCIKTPIIDKSNFSLRHIIGFVEHIYIEIKQRND